MLNPAVRIGESLVLPVRGIKVDNVIVKEGPAGLGQYPTPRHSGGRPGEIRRPQPEILHVSPSSLGEHRLAHVPVSFPGFPGRGGDVGEHGGDHRPLGVVAEGAGQGRVPVAVEDAAQGGGQRGEVWFCGQGGEVLPGPPGSGLVAGGGGGDVAEQRIPVPWRAIVRWGGWPARLSRPGRG